MNILKFCIVYVLFTELLFVCLSKQHYKQVVWY